MKKILPLLFLAVSAGADVTATREVAVDGFGGGWTSTSVDHFKGADKRSDTKSRFKNPVMNLAAGGERSQIILPAADKMLDLDHKKKTYREGSISALSKEMEKALGAGARPAGGAAPERPSAKISDAKVDVVKTGEKKTFGVFPCERYTVTLSFQTEDPETGEKTPVKMLTDLWTTPETGALKALRAAEAAHAKAFAAKMGLDFSAADASRMGAGAALALGVSGEQMSAKLKQAAQTFAKVKGYPIVTDLKWFVTQPAARRPAAAAPKEDDGDLPLSGGAAGLAGGLAAKMMKKKLEASREKSAARAGGEDAVFFSRTELVSLSESSLDGTLFQPPADYKKAARGRP